jgi:predicted amidohydrolase
MRVALVQMTSTDHLAENLACVRRAVDEAADRGAEFIALPENFAFLRREGNPILCAQGLDGEILDNVRKLARRHRLPILAGTFAELIEGEPRVYNTSVLITETGRIAAVYRKIHLFDVDLTERGGGVYRESAFTAPGDEVVVAQTAFGKVGLSVCYDVRFPELYRELAARGADWITVPSAFAPETGKVHWEVLLRARAIENQAFVLAPAQCGQHSSDRASHGHSLIVDPWGRILAEAGDEPAVIVADCDPEETERVRASLPALHHRRL